MWSVTTERDLLEFFVLGLGPEGFDEAARNMPRSDVWESTGWISEEILEAIYTDTFPTMKADFIDDTGRPRLRLRTLAKAMGVTIKSLSAYAHTDGDYSDNFLDAADFMGHCKERLLGAVGEDVIPFAETLHILATEAPPEVRGYFSSIKQGMEREFAVHVCEPSTNAIH